MCASAQTARFAQSSISLASFNKPLAHTAPHPAPRSHPADMNAHNRRSLESIMNVNVRNILVLMLLGILVSSISACNTIKGVGKDTQRAGEAIQREAGEHMYENDRDSR